MKGMRVGASESPGDDEGASDRVLALQEACLALPRHERAILRELMRLLCVAHYHQVLHGMGSTPPPASMAAEVLPLLLGAKTQSELNPLLWQAFMPVFLPSRANHRLRGSFMRRGRQYPALAQLLVADDFALIQALMSFEHELLTREFCSLFSDSPDVVLALLCRVVSKEVATCTAAHTLFRARSMAVFLLSSLYHAVALPYLSSVLAPVLAPLCGPTCVEVDPDRLEAGEDLAINQAALVSLVDIFFDAVLASACEVPINLRRAYRHVHAETEKRPGFSTNAVSSLFFLRMVCPSIITAEKLGSSRTNRFLVLLTKLIQSVANNSLPAEKYLAFASPMIERYQKRIHEFLRELTDVDDVPPPRKVPSADIEKAVQHLDDQIYGRVVEVLQRHAASIVFSSPEHQVMLQHVTSSHNPDQQRSSIRSPAIVGKLFTVLGRDEVSVTALRSCTLCRRVWIGLSTGIVFGWLVKESSCGFSCVSPNEVRVSDRVNALYHTHDHDHILVASPSGVYVCNAVTGCMLHCLPVPAFAFLSLSKSLVWLSTNTGIAALDLTNVVGGLEPVEECLGHIILDFALHVKAGQVWGASSGRDIFIWSSTTHALLYTIRGAHQRKVTCLQCHDSEVWSGSDDGLICIWDTQTFHLKKSITVGSKIYSIDCIHSSMWVCSQNQSLILISPRTHDQVKVPSYHTDGISCCELFAMQGAPLVYTGGRRGDVCNWVVDPQPLYCEDS
eukprot:CAMPEP_0177680926 /NCGR_PEP_ID=MMETSP0447-20121125/30433_1 /TAXON_ID=0 /ORGANISM="Stygamoeba regulata, Strain BSH-02190019" /LENGTH=730 /DNA_ID=CAMNT_0019190289 /DNA_START=92 /DNA_END=2284 /DNA_ORIENTATION=-